jgi:hypothetical protein
MNENRYSHLASLARNNYMFVQQVVPQKELLVLVDIVTANRAPTKLDKVKMLVFLAKNLGSITNTFMFPPA